MPVLLASAFAIVEPVLMDLVVAWLPLSPGDSPSFMSHMRILKRLYWSAADPGHVCLSFVIVLSFGFFHVLVWVEVFLFLFLRRAKPYIDCKCAMPHVTIDLLC